MGTLFDPVALLRVLLENSKLSKALAPTLHKTALKALEVALKDKDFGLDQLQVMAEAIGERQVTLIADALSESTLRASVKRFDPHHEQAAGPANKIDTAWARGHLSALASGAVEPKRKPKALDKLLPVKDRTPGKLRKLVEKMGEALFLDTLANTSDAGLGSVVKKLAPKLPETKANAGDIDPDFARRHIAELAGLKLPEAEDAGEPGAAWFKKLRKMYDAPNAPKAKTTGQKKTEGRRQSKSARRR